MKKRLTNNAAGGNCTMLSPSSDDCCGFKKRIGLNGCMRNILMMSVWLCCIIVLLGSSGVSCGNVVNLDGEEIGQLDAYLKKSKSDLQNSQLALLAFKETTQMLILTRSLSFLSITPKTIFYSGGFIGNSVLQLNASEVKFTSLTKVFSNSTGLSPSKITEKLTTFCTATLIELFKNNTFIPNYYICFFKTTLASENRVFFSTTSDGFRCLKLNSDGDVIIKDVSKGFIEDFATSLCVVTIIFIALLWVQGSFKRRIIDTKRYPFTNYYFGNDTDWNSSTFSDLSITLRPIFPFFKHMTSLFDKIYKLIFRSIQNRVDQEHIRKYKRFGASTLLKYQLFFDFFLFIVISCLSMVQLFVPSVLYFPNFMLTPVEIDDEDDFTSYWISGAGFVPVSLAFWSISLFLMILGIILLIATSSSKEKMMYWSTSSLPHTNILLFTDVIFKLIFIIAINSLVALLPFWTFTIKGILMAVITVSSIFYGSQQILIPTEKVIHAIHDRNYKMVVAFLAFSYLKELIVIIPFFIQIFMMAETIFGLVWSLILSFVANNSKLSLIGIFGIVINSVTSLLQDLLQPSRVTRKKLVERSDTFVFPSLTRTSSQLIQDNMAAKYGGIINMYSKLVESNENVDYTYKDILLLNDNLEELKDISRKRSQSVGKSDTGEAKLSATTIEKIHNTVKIKFEKNEDKNEEELKTRYTQYNDRPKYMHILFKKEIALLVRGIFLSTQEKNHEKLRVIFKRGERLYTPLLNTDIRKIHHNLVGRVKIATGNLSNYLVVILISMIIFLSFTYSGAESDGMDIMSNMAIVISIFIPQLFGRLDGGEVDELFERRIEETILLTKRDLAKKLDIPEKDLNFCIFNFQNDSDISNFLEHNTPAVSETIGRKILDHWENASSNGFITAQKFKPLILVVWDETLKINAKKGTSSATNDYLKTHSQFLSSFSNIIYCMSNFEADSFVSAYEFIHTVELLKRSITRREEDQSSDMDITFAFLFFCYLRGKSSDMGRDNCNSLPVSFAEDEYNEFFSTMYTWIAVNETKREKLKEAKQFIELVFSVYSSDQHLSLEHFLNSYRSVRSAMTHSRSIEIEEF